MKQKVLLLLVSLFLLMVTPFSYAHEGHNEAFSGGKTVTTTAQKIVVSPEGQHAIGLKTERVGKGTVSQTIEATGQVQAADNRAFDLNPTVEGVVKKVYAKQGDSVSKGQVLATIHSVEVANTLTQLLQDRARIQAEIAQARTQAQRDIAVLSKQVELTHANYIREQTLLNERISARKEYLLAKNEYETAQVELASTRKQAAQKIALLQKQLSLTIGAVKSQLQVLGLSGATVDRALATNRIISEIAIVSPATGVVTFRDITPGETLATGKRIYSIVNLSPIWVIVNVFQEQISKIQTGQTVRLHTPDNQLLSGTISSIGAVVDPNERTLPVRIVSSNFNHQLKPGMTVRADIVVGQSGGSRIVIPTSALLESNGNPFVYVKYDNTFQPVFVSVGQKTTTEVEVTEGLFDGDQIVVQGARQLQAQSLLSSQSTTATKAEHPEGEGSKGAFPPLMLGVLIGLGASGLVALLGWLILRKRPSPGKEG